MGYLLYISATIWAVVMGDTNTTNGMIAYVVSSIHFVGGVIVFAVNDKSPPPSLTQGD